MTFKLHDIPHNKGQSGLFKHSTKSKKLMSIKALEQFKNGMPIKTKKKISIATTGSKNPNYRGQKIGPVMVHIWIKKKYGKPRMCDNCKSSNKKSYHWANKNHKYKKLKSNWLRLCHSCHFKFDIKHNGRKYGINHAKNENRNPQSR